MQTSYLDEKSDHGCVWILELVNAKVSGFDVAFWEKYMSY